MTALRPIADDIAFRQKGLFLTQCGHPTGALFPDLADAVLGIAIGATTRLKLSALLGTLIALRNTWEAEVQS